MLSVEENALIALKDGEYPMPPLKGLKLTDYRPEN
jgi:hypothetical protein